jgi:hypothetical protein
MNTAALPDALADALGRVIADVRKEWDKDLERMNAESRAIIAELKAQVSDLTSQLKGLTSDAVKRVDEAISNVKDGRDGAPGKDGRDGIDGAPGKDGEPGKSGENGKDGAPGKDGRDGLDATEFMRAEGHLIVVMNNGSTKDLGEVDGKDGDPGHDGRDGKNGRDGVDGLSVDDFQAEFDGERSVMLRFVRGDVVREIGPFVFPVPIYRGVWKPDIEYRKGDIVTLNGSQFIAQKDAPTGRPEDGSGDWIMSVKRGRDGKNGERGEKGEKGDPGRPGRDLTQLGHDGTKW